MKSLFRTIALPMLVFVAVAEAAAAAQEGEARRRAQPRERAPRAEAPASAPAQQPERAAAPRSRGTDDQGRVRAPRDNGSSDRGEPRQRATYRAPEAAPAPPRTETRREPAPARQPATSSAAPSNAEPANAAPPLAASEASEEQQRRAVPRGSRPRGDNPTVGRAEPRDGRSGARDGGGRIAGDGRGRINRGGSWGGSRVYTSRGRVYNNYYYYYPRRWYPYGYGAFGGLGYFYYDPYTWYSYDPYWSRPHHYSYYSSSRHYGDSYYDTGELRLQVHPRHAEVYVDGYFAGHVDDFDGIFQALRLEEGPYKIEIVAPGYETLVVDVRIIPGRKTTFRGELRPRP